MGDTTDNATATTTSGRCVDAGLTQTEFAKRLQVSQTTVSSWETGSSQPRRSNLFILLSEFPGLTLEDINSEKNGFARRSLRRSSDSQPEQAPLLGRVAAGAPRDAFPIEEYVAVPHSLHERYPNAFFLRVSGESMNRVLPNGCLAPRCARVRGGQWTRVCVRDGERRLHGEACKRHRGPHNAHARFLPSWIRADRVHPKRRAPPPARDRAGGVVHHAGEIPHLTFDASGRSRALFSQSQFKGREGKSPCRARQSSCKGAAGASRRGGRAFAAAAKTAAWHRLPGNRLGPVPLLSRNRLVADNNRRYVRSCIRKTLC